jgi:cobalt-zinc-cadmium resistance protein CzcA
VRIERIYDRSDLIDITTAHRAAQHGRGHSADLLLQWAFLGNLRSAVIVARPFRSRCPSPSASWCCAANRPICCRSARSISDLIVDATVIMVENIFRT